MLTFTAAIEDLGKADPDPVTAQGIMPMQGSWRGDMHPRTDQAKTGDPLCDQALDGPVTRQNIDQPKVNREYDVPYGAGGSVPLDDPTTYIDRHVPQTMTVGDITFDPAEPYVIHENLEQKVMDILSNAGMDDEEAYRVAHFDYAEKAEGAWYAHHGIDRAEAERQEDVWLAKIQHENPENPPPNLYTKPYPHHYVQLAQDEPFAEAGPTPQETARGRAILQAAFGIAEKREDGVAHDLRAAVYAMLLKTDPQVAALMAPEIAAEMAQLRDGLQGVKDMKIEIPEETMKHIHAVVAELDELKKGTNLRLDEKRGIVTKIQPTAADVHATTALGNEDEKKKKRKAKNFLSTIGETHPKTVEKDEHIERETKFRVTKVDEDKHTVFGWASVTHINGELVIDKQDDIIESTELEKAVYDYVLHSREQGDMHERKDVGRLIESTVFTAEKSEKCGIHAFDPTTGDQLFGWYVGFKVLSPDVWKRIKSGHLPEFSIGGRAVRVPV